MTDVGFLALVIALIVSVYALFGFVLSITTGNKKFLASARGGVAAVLFSVTVASLVLINALMTSDFSFEYVYKYTTTDLAFFYKLSAFWAGNAGSLLLWAWILSIYTAVVTFSKKYQDENTITRVSAILLVNVIFFLTSMVLFGNPFEKNPVIPQEGNGLNPMLLNPGMVIHPVTLYLGYVGFAVPFAFAMASLMMNRTDDTWIKLTRRWTIFAWMFLSIGNLYGAKWAYVELGWGGFWAWDPVENASFMPWLTGSAFLHSIMVQERKKMLKIWNMALIIITYWLTLYGTFLVRSGIIASVHAFPKNNLSYWFGFFMLFMLFWAVYLVITRRNILQGENEFGSYVSKESSFLLNNVILLGGAFAVFWGTNFPLTSQIFTGTKLTLSAPWYNAVVGPILLAMVLLMGICPLIAWQKTTLAYINKQFFIPLGATLMFAVLLYMGGIKEVWGMVGFSIAFFVILTTLMEFVKGTLVRRKMTGEGVITALGSLMTRNRRRYGGYLVHIGIFLITLGVLGESVYSVETLKNVKVGEKIEIEGRFNDYQLTFNGMEKRQEGKNDVYYADLEVMKNGKPAGIIRPEKIKYFYWPQPRTEVAIKSGPVDDLYVTLAGWNKFPDEATFKVNVNPLVYWMWMGGYILVFGAVFALWPGKGYKPGLKSQI